MFLDKLKILLGITNNEQDEFLNNLIDMSIEYCRNYTHNDEISHMGGAILSIATYLYNMDDSQGLKSESYSSVSYTYLTDIPEYLVRQLNPLRKIRVI